ncbi:hypothetical protein [Paenibacillus sp. AR247]
MTKRLVRLAQQNLL